MEKNNKIINIGDVLVSNIKDLKYKKGVTNAYNYLFDEISVFESKDNISLMYIYLGENKMMEVFSKNIVEIENEGKKPTSNIQMFYEQLDYVMENPLFIYNKLLEKFSEENKETIESIFNGLEDKEQIINEINSKIAISKEKNNKKKEELFLDNYKLAMIENAIYDGKLEAKKYNLSLNDKTLD